MGATTRGLTLALPLALAGTAAAAQCPKGPPVEVIVRTSTAPVTYRQDLDRAALSKFATGVALGRHGGTVMGLTVSNYAIDYKLTHQAAHMPDGRWCVSVGRVEARLAIPETTVHVASNYAKGSCQYDEILEHEHQHVRITEAALKRAAPNLEAVLRKAVAEVNPLLVSAPAQSDKAIKAALSRSVQAFMTELSQQSHKENAAIDTKESYKQVSNNCQRW